MQRHEVVNASLAELLLAGGDARTQMRDIDAMIAAILRFGSRQDGTSPVFENSSP